MRQRPSLQGAMLACLIVTPAFSRAGEASSTQDILQALSRAKPGEIIRLAPGEYAPLSIRKFQGQITIASADHAHPAVFHDLSILGSSGVTLEGLELSAADLRTIGPGGLNSSRFNVAGARNVTLRGLKVHGSPTGTVATDISGLLVRASQNVVVENSDFEYLHNGLTQLDDDTITIRGNHFHHLRDDGIRGGGSSNVLIENNLCDSNHADATDTDHPDCIQFWTSNTKTPAHDITIRNNRYFRGSGHPVQGIFLRDETGHLPYERVVVSGNDIEGSLWHGIAVGDTIAPLIEGNRVCGYPDQESWIGLATSPGAILRHNRASTFKFQPGLHPQTEDDKTIPRCSPHTAPAEASR